MLRVLAIVALTSHALPARADVPCGSEVPTRPVDVDAVADLQTRCRAPFEAFLRLGARTAVDVDAAEARAASAGVDAAGELALNHSSGFQLRAAGDFTVGTGPSAVPSGGAELTVATAPGLFTTELSQRIEVERLPNPFASRFRTPGLRYDELATTVRTSLLSIQHRALRDVVLPVSVERAATYTDDPEPATRWSLRIGLASIGRGDTMVDVVDFRSDWIGGASLHHFVIVDAHTVGPKGHFRLRIGGADKAPTQGGEGLSYDLWEGEIALYAPTESRLFDATHLVGGGFSSDCFLTMDGKLAREHRFTVGTTSTTDVDDQLAVTAFLAHTSLGEVDTPMAPVTTAWAGGIRTVTTYHALGMQLIHVAEAGYSYHRRVGELTVEPGFFASTSLGIAIAAGKRPTRNRLPD